MAETTTKSIALVFCLLAMKKDVKTVVASSTVYMSYCKQCLEKIRMAGEVACVIGGKMRDYAFIAKKTGAFFQYD